MSVPLAFIDQLAAPLPGLSLGDHIAAAVTDSRRVTTLLDCLPSTLRPAIWSTDASRPPLTHAALRTFVSHFVLPTSGLHGRLGPNDRVMVVLPTGPENALALLAVSTYHTCAPVNSGCTAGELIEDATRLRVKAILTTPDASDRLELARLREQLRCEVIFVHSRTKGSAGLFRMRVMKHGDGEEDWAIVQNPNRLPSRPHGLQDQSLVLHTSGTSGKKKVVPYTLRSLIVGTCAVVRSWDLRADDVNMNMMPLFHVGGIVRNLWAPVLSGGSAIMCPGFDSTAFWSVVVTYGATWYYAAPTMHHAILGSKPESISPATDTRIRMIANAAGGLLPSLAQQLKATYGAVILPSYGMTECMPIASPPTTYQLERPGCSGVACGPYLSVRDPSNLERELPRGSTGAISVRGVPAFDGYETDPGAPLDTSAFSSEGWFDSGDLGYMDEDGYLYITGRSKEIINKGGEVISPFEIEEAITSVAKARVKATIAFSIPHDVLQETIGVVVVPVPGAPRVGLSELLDLLKAQLHPSKWPFAVVYMEDLPKNNAGKPLRINLAQRLGIECLTDETPAICRHFEGTVPDKNAPLSEPIPCNVVSLDVAAVEHAMAELNGVDEVAVRLRKNGQIEALVAALPSSGLTPASIAETLMGVIPGYAIPAPLHVLSERFSRTSEGFVDWDLMEAEVGRRNETSLSPGALIVRNIVAELLDKDPATINRDSDFFLLGGNSLLLGRLAHHIRKETGATVRVPSIFTQSTINGIAALVEADAHAAADISEKTAVNTVAQNSAASSQKSLSSTLDLPKVELDLPVMDHGRSQTHPLPLIVQAIPLVFFYPLKVAFTWTGIVFILSLFTAFISGSYWDRVGSLLVAIVGARLLARITLPLVAIAFKWIVIGRYKPGTYRFWSNYHLRWWITNQILRILGRGIFSMHPSLEIIYYRMLGARIGKDVYIDPKARLGEYDLLTLHDRCRIDNALVRGFCVEREGSFRLEPIVIGRDATVNTYTQLAPGAVIPDGASYGPHASSHDEPSPDEYAQYNRASIAQPHWALKVFVAAPVIILVKVAAYIPWFAALVILLAQAPPTGPLTNLERVIVWFASPSRVAWHSLARIIRVVFPPVLQLIFGIILKRIMGLNREGSAEDASQWVLLRRFINHHLLSQTAIKRAYDIIGSHYEVTSVIWRCMGAKVGKRVYWPGSGVFCPDPELFEVGDDVVFGSRSEVFTTDGTGSAKVVVRAGAMIADRVVLLPGTTVGKRTVMGSGALAKRGATYEDGSIWMGSERGEAVCLKKGSKDTDDGSSTLTPFGRAFYKREASYFVYPYLLLVFINVAIAIVSAGYWSIGAVVGTQILNQLRIHLPELHLFSDGPRQIFVLYGLISCCFILTYTLQAVIALLYVVVTKWLVIGRRVQGNFDWDKSSYCQRWQLHLTLAKPMYRGYGIGGILGTIGGTAYIVWYLRALGAKIGKDCAVFAGGRVGLMTEPDLVELGDHVSLDDCSVVAHINSRGNFSLNQLNIASSSAMRSGSRLLSGASMEENSILLEHTLLTSGEIAESDGVYAGWPARRLDDEAYVRRKSLYQLLSAANMGSEYRELQRIHYKLEEEKRMLYRKIEDHQRELREAKRRLESMLLTSESMRSSTPSTPIRP